MHIELLNCISWKKWKHYFWKELWWNSFHIHNKRKKLDLTWNCFSILSPREGSSDRAQQSPSTQEAAAAAPGEPGPAPAPGQALLHPEPLSQRFLSDQFRLAGNEEPDPGERERDQPCFSLQLDTGQGTVPGTRKRQHRGKMSHCPHQLSNSAHLNWTSHLLSRTKAPVCLTSPSPKPRISSEGNSLLSLSSELQRILNIKFLGVMVLPFCTGTSSKRRLLHSQSSS